MKNILLPTDFSDNAWNAIFTALKLFHRDPCRFLILNTYQPPLDAIVGDSGDSKMYEIYDTLREESEAGLHNLLDYLTREAHNPKHHFKTLSRPGDLLTVIRKIIPEEAIDLVVMGTQGATGAQKIFIGSNTVRVIQHIENRPIIAVPQAYDLQRLEKVVFPTDYMEPVEKFELEPLLDIVAQWKATIHVVYATDESKLKDRQEVHRKLLQQRMEGVRTRFRDIPLSGNLSQTFSNYSHELRADMIALVHRKRHFLKSLVREAVVKRLAFETELPLLILPQLD